MDNTNILIPDATHPLDVVAKMAGGRDVLAAQLDVSSAAIGNWKMRGIPPKQCVRIERLTDGKVTRRELRPDDYFEIWPDLPPAPANTVQPATETVATQGA